MRKTMQPEHVHSHAAMAQGRFKGFKTETERECRTADISEKAALTKAVKAWYTSEFEEDLWGQEDYGRVKAALRGIILEQEEINEFILFLKEHGAKDEDSDITMKSGLFLSALINQGNLKEYRLDIRGMNTPSGLGFMNEKHLTIFGDVGNECGYGNSAFIEVHGNASSISHAQTGGEAIVHGDGHDVGHIMVGGRLTVHGNCNSVGREMYSGRIDILGKVWTSYGLWPPARIGQRMIGGEIHIATYDRKRTYITPEGGLIYVGGRLVFDNGRCVGLRLRAEKWLQDIIEGRK